MKQFIFISLFLTFAAVSHAQTETITVKTNIYCDHCMRCESCGANIISSVRSGTKGVKKVKVNEEEGSIFVTYNAAKTDPEKIKTAITAAGYDADEMKARADAYQALDNCCKKKM